MQLVITSTARGWLILDAQRRLPPSPYSEIEEAVKEGWEYLRHHGGGRLVVREGETVVFDLEVPGAAVARKPEGAR